MDFEYNSIEVRYMIEEISHQLQMLTYSQDEIGNALKDCPSDFDLAAAYVENMEVIQRKKTKIAELKEFLALIDPAFREEANATNTCVRSIEPVHTVATVDIISASGLSSINMNEATRSAATDTGIFL